MGGKRDRGDYEGSGSGEGSSEGEGAECGAGDLGRTEGSGEGENEGTGECGGRKRSCVPLIILHAPPVARPRTDVDDNPCLQGYDEEHYTYYKSLPMDRRESIAKAERQLLLERAATPLRFRVIESGAPEEAKRIALRLCDLIQRVGPRDGEGARAVEWCERMLRLPFGRHVDLPVDIRGDGSSEAAARFLRDATEAMDKQVHGHRRAKQTIAHLIASRISAGAAGSGGGFAIGLEGPMGCAKTSIARHCVAGPLRLPMAYVALGGMRDSHHLTGHGSTYVGATAGAISSALVETRCMNPVIVFDELDKVAGAGEEGGDSITSVLIHLTDPLQNAEFRDNYFAGVRLDLSRAVFVFTYNDPSRVSPVLLDRMHRVSVKGYTTEEKARIVDDHLMPAICGMHSFPPGSLVLPREVRDELVQRFRREQGVRQLRNALAQVVSAVNMREVIDGTARGRILGHRREPVAITMRDIAQAIPDEPQPPGYHSSMYS